MEGIGHNVAHSSVLTNIKVYVLFAYTGTFLIDVDQLMTLEQVAVSFFNLNALLSSGPMPNSF